MQTMVTLFHLDTRRTPDLEARAKREQGVAMIGQPGRPLSATTVFCPLELEKSPNTNDMCRRHYRVVFCFLH